MFSRISTNASVDFASRCFFKDKSFSEPLQASCFRVAFISGDDNINEVIFFVLYFPFRQAFLGFLEVGVHRFSKIFSSAKDIFMEILEFLEQLISRTTVNNCLFTE